MLLCLALSGCSRREEAVPAPAATPQPTPGPQPTPATAPQPAPAAQDAGPAAGPAGGDAGAAPPTHEWTAGTVSQRADGPPALLRAVRTARQDGFDRVVFDLEGAAAPGFHVEYVDRPVRRCGSGDTTELAGDAWLRVRLEPAQAHTEAGQATVPERERTPALPVLLELEQTCDFEGQVEWVLGVRRPGRYRVLVLQAPARLVVDVQH